MGKIDIIISSTDKNFMVPIGGSLIYSSNKEMINKIKKNYPGRASISPIRDILITLLEMGKLKYIELIKERKRIYSMLKEEMNSVAKKYGEKIIETPNNKISLCLTMNKICANSSDKKDVTYFGSLFYYRQISGIRVIAKSDIIDFNGYKFSNYGSHCEKYENLPYCSFAAAIGMTEKDVRNLYFFYIFFLLKFILK
jgi:O-phospho-L-seryl-tRNASec:L-selenocysteinyl-tRNA synthase